MVVLPVRNTRNTSYKRDYGICIPPMFGNIRVAEVVEFLEMSQLLGASYFTFYDYNISDSVRIMLSYYEREGLARVLPWNLPTYITVQDVHYHGQIFFHARLLIPINKSSQLCCVQRFRLIYNPASE